MYMGVLSACACCLLKPEDGVGSPGDGDGVLDGCASPCGFWDVNPGPLPKQPVL